MASANIPQLSGLDHTIAFLRDGYRFISKRCDLLDTDVFRARIMLSSVICARGADAAEMFYGGGRFTRQKGAMPTTVLRLLQDKGSVQQLDGEAHRHRKSLFVDLLMTTQAEAEFSETFRGEWVKALGTWAKRPSIVLFDEVNRVLTRTICRWMRLPCDDIGGERLVHDLSLMIEQAGSFGPKTLIALLRRRRTEVAFTKVVKKFRTEPRFDKLNSPLARIAYFRDFDGRELSLEAAAVEILNILRPTVAIGQFIAFAAVALHDHPEWRQALRGADDHLYEKFAEEIRRLYPFFPVIGGIAKHDFQWREIMFAKGDWMLLDLHGTNHDPRRFANPYSFHPERAPSWHDQDYSFVPQGGGQTGDTHRCPGEQFTVGAIRDAVRLLVENMEYDLPPQDLSICGMPARPKSGVVLANVAIDGG